MKMFWFAGILASLVITGCRAGAPTDPEATGDDPGEEAIGEAQQEVKVGDYYDPPRCGPRNCVAWCVTCEYDMCRIGGNTIAECNALAELCVDDC